MDQAELQELANVGEGQTVEYKESLGSGAQNEALRSLVAFANSDGGRVFFGVADDGTVVGVDIGKKTVEDLANRITQQSYPSLPVTIEQVGDEKAVLVVEAPKDTAPLVGAYLLSRIRLDPSSTVDATTVRAFRRVGRTDQQVNFMLLRPPASSDPDVSLRLDGGGSSAGQYFPRSCVFYYSNSGPGWAYGLSFSAEHETYQVTTAPGGISLPPPGQETPHHTEHPRNGAINTEDEDLDRPGADKPVHLTARYRDGAGLIWQSALELIPTRRNAEKQLYEFREGNRSRRIVEFPSKSTLAGGLS